MIRHNNISCRKELSLSSILILTIAILSTGSLGGCASKAPYNPFAVEKSQLYEQVKTIALMPIRVPNGVENASELSKRYEALMVSKLQKGHFSVIPSSEWSSIFNGMQENVGGVFDPITGKLDQEKSQTILDLAMREFKEKHQFDAFLFSEIGTRKIRASRGSLLGSPTISWDGVEESSVSNVPLPQQITSFFVPIFLPTQNQFVMIQALSLFVNIQDKNINHLYGNAGGIQLLHKWSKEEMKYVPIPVKFLFLNKKKDKIAVNVALDPLIEKEETPSPVTTPTQ